jgi:ribosomal protein S8
MKCPTGETFDRTLKNCRHKKSPGRKPSKKSPKKPLPETTFTRVASPKKTSPKKINTDSKSEDTCYMFNDIKFCEPTLVGYRETQQEQRCGLHAYNNLFQNQTKVEKPQILTKEKMDEYCSLVQSNITQVKVCNEYGNYYSDVLIRAINAEVKDVHVYYDNSSQTVAKLNQILNQEKFVGAMYLYKAPGMENHWVTLLPREKKFLVVDSHKFNQKLHNIYVHNALVQIDRGNAEVLDSSKEVLKYFRNFLGMIIVMHTKKLPRCPAGTRKDKNGHCKELSPKN